jgi:hypothetical protein
MLQKFSVPGGRVAFGLSLAVGVAAVALVARAASPEAEKPASPKLTVEQARREVRLLDDLYKTAIVYINDVYVEDANSVAAGETARDLFAAMKAKGWHDARLVDATGEPLNDENAPADDFEKTAIQKILAGETYIDQVVSEKGGNYLRAATLVPAVNDKCVICHPGNKVGDALGAVSYRIPVE